ncbi:pirin family protein [Curvibacter sp. APW13]|uniref:pirin family protein n=1 Tax=Curvibacter sp. APW13 TaxID=3077236 RepID=UPI0028DD531E|nr:pirin family protein [Curvibacter sp. APW13]MDT8989996.1 pirin family protein [Curvibacter sp. APW13]
MTHPTTRWHAEEAPVGHFTVLRALPTRAVQAVGPFVFLDHFGPFPASPETLPAHPHAGIEVMTYLLEGANEHRDSYGHRGIVETGGAQWMRAGRGILHAETNLPQRCPTIHGLQIWARLPAAVQHSEPAYRAIAASDVPQWTVPTQEGSNEAGLRLLSGAFQDRQGPIPLSAPALLLHVQLPPGCRVALEMPAGWEYGAYGIDGSSRVNDTGDVLQRGDFACLPGTTLALHNPAAAPANVLLLGGAPAQRPLVFGGPFVLDSPAALRQAQRDYFDGKMGMLDGVPY